MKLVRSWEMTMHYELCILPTANLLIFLYFTNDCAVEEINDARSVSRITVGMGNHDDSRTLAVELGEEFHDLAPVVRVKIAGRLVGEDDGGPGDERAGYGDALLLSAGELLGKVARTVAHIDLGKHFFDAFTAFGAFETEIGEREFDIVGHIDLINEVETLKHEAYATLAELSALAFAHTGHFCAVEVILSAGRIVEEAEDVEEGGFSTSAGTHYGYKFAVGYVEVDTVESHGLDFVCAESL